MVTEIILPKLGQTMEDGLVVEWFKQEGDPVDRGDLLFTVESDKATLEVEATARGFLRKILVPDGERAQVLAVVGLITRTLDEELEDWKDRMLDKVGPTFQPSDIPIAQSPPRLFASPRARKAAKEKQVDLGDVLGTGPAGRIVEADVLAYSAARPRPTPVAERTAAALGVDLAHVAPGAVGGRITKADVLAAAGAGAETPTASAGASLPTSTPGIDPAAPVLPAAREPVSGLRRIIAERMSASHTTTARVTLVTEADATALVDARERLKAGVSEEWGFAPGYNDFLALTVARALREFPYMNARIVPGGATGAGDAIERLPYVNLGMAVDTEQGLLVPVIRDADKKGLRAFGTEFRSLVERARVRKSLPDDLAGGTFTITNLGMFEIDAFTPIINLPEAAILGAGRIEPKAVVRGGEIVARHMWTLSLAFDHRLVDGAPAARFLQRIKRMIENPWLLLG